MTEKLTGLELLRAPFPENQISKLPKPTKAQTDALRADFRIGIRCNLCGGWHHKDVIHLDYVGHAALTDRLLDCDIEWNYEWVATEPNGNPILDNDGGAWIRLTVCGVTRLGYGDAQEKTGGNAMKERIGDALRNSAMRFGAALNLWHKGDLHIECDVNTDNNSMPSKFPDFKTKIEYATTVQQINDIWVTIPVELQSQFRGQANNKKIELKSKVEK